ncbi:unnamed protein product [Mycena citricolor]|uniref:Uncharacterized protein n=1 Tax=Mycena citricolor TaxID=2018698 RepID=A0AAD2Q3Z9_9AGAR|nr:unnamed protein product [Mycena citricolor]
MRTRDRFGRYRRRDTAPVIQKRHSKNIEEGCLTVLERTPLSRLSALDRETRVSFASLQRPQPQPHRQLRPISWISVVITI